MKFSQGKAPDQREAMTTMATIAEEDPLARPSARLFDVDIGSPALCSARFRWPFAFRIRGGFLLIDLSRVHYEFLTPLRKTSIKKRSASSGSPR